MEEDVPLSEIKTILKQLIAIPSVNPDHVQDAEIKQTICGEARMAEKLRESFTSFGAEVEVEEIQPGRPNVYAIFTGNQPLSGPCSERASGNGLKWLCVDVHMDTVPVVGMTPYEPFSGVEDDQGRLHGRGSCDTKATLAVVLGLLQWGAKTGRTLRP
eukprot:RCo014440